MPVAEDIWELIAQHWWVLLELDCEINNCASRVQEER
jgi:hypothetical protein